MHKMAADGIFISYRREESAGFAGRLYDRLVTRFGRERVFMDVEGIDPGTDFVDAIESAVASCRALIVVIGPRWTTVEGGTGKRRLDDPQDFVRLETAAALKRSIRVLPVLVDGAEMPQETDLPDDLVPLLRRQAIEINHKHWESSTNDLLRALAKILDEDDAPDAAPDTATRRRTRVALFAAVPIVAIAAYIAWTMDFHRTEEATAPTRTVIASTPPSHSPPAGIATAARPAEPDVGEDAKPQITPDTDDPGETTGPDDGPAVTAGAEPASTEVAPTEAPRPAIATPETAASAASPSDGAASTSPEKETTSGSPAEPTPTRPPSSTVAAQPERSILQPAEPDISATPRPATTTPATPSPPPQQPPRTAARTESPPARTPPPAAPREPVPTPSATPSKLPQTGEQWTYSVSGIWATNRERTYVFGVEATDGRAIQESMTEITRAGTRSLPSVGWTGGSAEIVQRRGKLPEFSPFLAAFDEVGEGTRWRGVSTPSYDGRWDDWHTTGRIVGMESVTVPAGQFRAWKADIWSNRQAIGGPAMAALEPVSIRFEIWFAPTEKRYVKLIRTIKSAAQGNMEKDTFQLVSVKRGG